MYQYVCLSVYSLSASLRCAGPTCPAGVQKVAGAALQRVKIEVRANGLPSTTRAPLFFPLLRSSDDDSPFTMSPNIRHMWLFQRRAT